MLQSQSETAPPLDQNFLSPDLQGASRSSGKWRLLFRRHGVSIIAALLGAVIGSLATFAATSHRPTDRQPPASAECVSSLQEFIHRFQSRTDPESLLETPACISAPLFGIVHISPLLHGSVRVKNQFGRQFAFAFGPETLERLLVFGLNGGDHIVSTLALGAIPAGAYSLLVWEQSSPVAAPRPLRGSWDNLEAFLHRIYGTDLPPVESAIQAIASVSFHTLTGCDPDALLAHPHDPTAAGCSPEYIAASADFPFNRTCNLPPVAYAGGFSTTCANEQRLLNMSEGPSAVALRAFLAQGNGFNPLFTGYGYTADAYPDPIIREYWVENIRIDELPEGYQVVPFHVKGGDGASGSRRDERRLDAPPLSHTALQYWL